MKIFNILKIILDIAELTACIAGFVYWKKIKSTYWRFFPLYLGIIVIAEIIGTYLNARKMSHYTVVIFSYGIIPLEIFFFLWLFYNEFKKLNVKWLSVAGGFMYILCFLTDILFVSRHNYWFLSFSYTAGILILVIHILSFLFRLAKSDEVLSIKTNMMFWVCLGLLVFYLCSLPFFGMGNFLLKNYNNIFINYARLTFVFNCMMYALFTIAFICGKPKPSYSSY